MLGSKRLGESGFVKMSLPISFMNRLINIRKVMLSPSEKKAFSAISRFFNFNSFKMAIPGANIK
jgi:hypothetical protein